MTRWVARAALAVIAAGVAVGLWLPRVHVENRVWPIATTHPRALAFVAVMSGWTVVGLAVLPLLLEGLPRLWRQAK